MLCVRDARTATAGPPTVAEVRSFMSDTAAAYPGATVLVSSLDDFASAVLNSSAARELPVITSEIGDS